MTDTITTRAALEALLADNTSRAISPQDLRDMLASLDRASGGAYLTASSDTVISVTNTYQLLIGSLTSLGLNNLSNPSGMRIQNDAPTTRRFFIHLSASMTSDTSSVIFTAAFYKNGVIESGSEMERKTAGAADVGAAGMTWVVDLANGDYIEPYVKANKANTLTLKHMGISIRSELI